MSQKYIKKKNNNAESTAYGKYFASAVYDEHFIEADELANYIQQQASVKKSDIKAEDVIAATITTRRGLFH